MCVRACAYTFIYITSLTQGQGAKSSRRSVRHGPSPAFWASVAEEMPGTSRRSECRGPVEGPNARVQAHDFRPRWQARYVVPVFVIVFLCVCVCVFVSSVPFVRFTDSFGICLRASAGLPPIRGHRLNQCVLFDAQQNRSWWDTIVTLTTVK